MTPPPRDLAPFVARDPGVHSPDPVRRSISRRGSTAMTWLLYKIEVGPHEVVAAIAERSDLLLIGMGAGTAVHVP